MKTITKSQHVPTKPDAPELYQSEKGKNWIHTRSFKSNRFLGIEFDRHLIKFILTNGSNVKNNVQSLKVKLLSSEQESDIQKILVDNLCEMGVKSGHHVTISIPRHAVHVKIMRLPGQNIDELRKMARFQMQKDIPMPPAEVVFDIRIMKLEEDGYARIMVVMARKQEIFYYLNICKKSQLIVDAIRLNVEAIHLSFLQFLGNLPEVESKCVALVDVDFSATNVMIIDCGTLLFCRSVGKGVEDLMERMVGPERNSVYDSWIEELSQGVAETIKTYEQNTHDACVEYIALTGWLPRVQTLSQSLKDHLSIPVKWFDLMIPLGHFVGTYTDTSTHHWFSISTLLGMAGASKQNMLDLRPMEERQIVWRQIQMRNLAKSAILFVYIIVLVVATAKFSLHNHKLALSELKSQIELLQPRVRAANKFKIVQQNLKNENGSTKMTSVLIAQLLEKLPPGIRLSSMTFIRGEKFLVHGVANNLSDVLNLPPILAQQPGFTEAVISSVDRRQSKGQKEEFEFEMKINLR